jgi:hypothetical protein
MKLYTNSNESRLGKRLNEICNNTTLNISVAFFSHYNFIKTAIKNGCNILMIVRLGLGTNPDELLKIFNDKEIIDNINIRYYACDTFHPKLYIVEDVCAIVGSSNLTHSGIFNNLEINIEIESEDPMYEKLQNEFNYEFEYADVLTKEKVLEFKKAYDEIPQYKDYLAIYPKIGEVKIPNINSDDKRSHSSEIIESFRRKYQLYITSFNRLVKMYAGISSERKFEKELPMRIEIDRFLSWIKDTQFKKEEYIEIPKKAENEIANDVKRLKSDFINSTLSEYYKDTYNRFSNIINILGTIEGINNHDKNELLDALLLINAIHDQLRFYSGGLDTLKKEFLENNDEEKLKKSLIYLLTGEDEYSVRIFNIANVSKYKLEVIGENSLKELYGYINKENIPTCNQRLLHSMQYLGFGRL